LDDGRDGENRDPIEPTINASEIKKAYRLQLSQYHPDRVASLGADLRRLAEERAKSIKAAFAALEAKRWDGDVLQYLAPLGQWTELATFEPRRGSLRVSLRIRARTSTPTS
jgi:hypothetical protein